MTQRGPQRDSTGAVDVVLGYLNFSAGVPDPAFLSNLNSVFAECGADCVADRAAESAEQASPAASSPVDRAANGFATPLLAAVSSRLRNRLGELCRTSSAFANSTQAETALELIFGALPTAYLQFHGDLLFHQSATELFNSLMMGRVAEAVLAQGGPWDEADRIAEGAIRRLNDFLGYRPIATLESRRIEPYAHEWVRPVPLFIRDVGVAAGRYTQVVAAAIDLLRQTDEDILRRAHFTPDLLDELAFDPRAYDFDHPVNKRPNYHFGEWDPNRLDDQGQFRRYVVRQVTLEALMRRYETTEGLPKEELLTEAAAVLAGTVLMATGICGTRPNSFASTESLGTLLPRIAQYRDDFYEWLLGRIQGDHGKRLRSEAALLRQPFGGARQSLNAELARRRATQLQHVQLARVYARMGYADAARRQADIVPVASARFMCQLDTCILTGHRALNDGCLDEAANVPPQILELMRRGIQCGALIDPWNILGFDANFSLFPSLENSVHDHRADEMIELLERVFALLSRIWSESAALNRQDVANRIDVQFQEMAEWWRQFAAHEVSSVKRLDSLEVYDAARNVANAMRLWHQGGASTGDVRFWAPHAEMFGAAKAYALVVGALIERRDHIAASSLLIHWLSQAERVPLEQGDVSFSALAERWLLSWLGEAERRSAQDRWTALRRFLDFLEANADEYWKVPEFHLGIDPAQSAGRSDSPRGDSHDESLAGGIDGEEDADEELYGAAYDDMVYRDSTDDGFDGEVFDTGDSHGDELERESRRLADRLTFLNCVARLWKATAGNVGRMGDDQAADTCLDVKDVLATLRRWVSQATSNYAGLNRLLDEVSAFPLPRPSANPDSLLEYDRQRLTREALLERTIAAAVEMGDAVRMLSAAHEARRELASSDSGDSERDAAAASTAISPDDGELPADIRVSVSLLAALLRRDHSRARSLFQQLQESLRGEPLLYVPLNRGGESRRIVEARTRQQAIQELLTGLPRAGLLHQTAQLLETARAMERQHPVGQGAVTEFDELFRMGYSALVDAIVRSSGRSNGNRAAAESLVALLEQMTELLLRSWLAHSRTLRLSILEKVDGEEDFQDIVDFVQRYGGELFTQRFLNLGNIRAILHQGVEVWLAELDASDDPECDFDLCADLDQAISRSDAAQRLTLILEAVVENYSEYRDYNSTTTQSDRGEMLYSLLDFLRLRARYDRIAWNLRPVIWAHEQLVRAGKNEAARIWRRALRERVAEQADEFLHDLTRLQTEYAMRMPTVADRLQERFFKPMTIDRMRALVRPAMTAEGDSREAAFEMLESLTTSLAREPSGAGLDLPLWLEALDEEVENVRGAHVELEIDQLLQDVIPCHTLSLEEFEEQLGEIAELLNRKRRRSG